MTETVKVTVPTYRGGGQSFPIEAQDIVFVNVKGREPKPTGYNHYRAWSSALKAATR